MSDLALWIILGPDGREVYKSIYRPPPDVRYPKGSTEQAPGREFVVLEGGSGLAA